MAESHAPDSLVRITVNGEDRSLGHGSSVADLLASLGLETRKVAVERNGEIVPRSTHAAARLAEGDRLEIIAFVGGG